MQMRFRPAQALCECIWQSCYRRGMKRVPKLGLDKPRGFLYRG